MTKYLLLLWLLMASPAWGALALDGASTSTTGTSATATSTLTTTGPGLVFFVCENNTSVTITGVSGATLGAFAQREVNVSGTERLYVFYKYSSAAVSTELITATLSDTGAFWSASSFGVSGVPAANFFDVNGSLPNKGNTDPRTVSTTAADTFIFGAFRTGEQTPTAGSGWTAITSGNYLFTEYKIVSAVQTNLSVDMTTGSGSANGAIADAVVLAQTRRSVAPVIFQ